MKQSLIVKRIRLTSEQDSFLRKYCKEIGVPMNVWIRVAVDERIEKLHKKHKKLLVMGDMLLILV
jgi:hypothetical protein